MAQPTDLEALSYRDLQAQCKARDLKATGTKEELIRRLSETSGSATPAKPATAAKTPRAVAKSPAKTPKAAAPKNLADDVKQAARTPLPKATPSRAAAVKRGAAKEPAVKRAAVVGVLLGALLALGTASGVAYCQLRPCPALREAADLATVQLAAARATVLQGAAQLRYAAAAKHAALQARVRAALAPAAPAEPAAPPAACVVPGYEAAEALVALLAPEGEAWTNLRQTAAAIFAGQRLQADKASGLLLPCSTPGSCQWALHHIYNAHVEHAAPLVHKDAVDLGADAGALQGELVAFLEANPCGTVVLNKADQLDPALVPVLVSLLSEGGGFEHNGKFVPAKGVTVALLAHVPPAAGPYDEMDEHVMSSFVKETLVGRLASPESGADLDASLASARALRRRLDLVVPLADLEARFSAGVAAADEAA